MFEYFFLYYTQEHAFVHSITFKVKVEELPNVVGETELVKKKNLYQKGVRAPAKGCQVTTVQVKSFPQILLHSHKPSVPPNISLLTACWKWSKPLRSMLLRCWFTQGHIARSEKKQRFYIRSSVLCYAFSVHHISPQKWHEICKLVISTGIWVTSRYYFTVVTSVDVIFLLISFKNISFQFCSY